MTPGHNFGDIIAIVNPLNSLYKDFDTITASLLETEDKTIDQIWSILQLKEAKNLSKEATENTENLAITFRDKYKGASWKKKPIVMTSAIIALSLVYQQVN